MGANCGLPLYHQSYSKYNRTLKTYTMMLIKETTSPYDFDTTVSEVEQRIQQKNGWKWMNTINQQENVLNASGANIGKMKIIQYCNGEFAYRMLNADDRKKISVMMPKSISVYETSKGETKVAIFNGLELGKQMGEETTAITKEVSMEVKDILNFLNFEN